MFATMFFPVALGFIAAVTAQTGTDPVTVYANDTRIVVTQDGEVLSPAYLNSPDLTYTGFFSECGGVMVLNDTIDQTAEFTFNGTSIQITFIGCDLGGLVSLYLDGTFWEDINTYSNAAQSACTAVRAINVNLAETSHKITVVNGTPLNRTFIQDFQYVPFASVPPPATTSLASQSTPPSVTVQSAPSQSAQGSGSGSNSGSTSKKSNTGAIIGGIAGAAIVVIAILLLLFFRRRSRTQQTTSPQRPDLVGEGVAGAGGSTYEPKDYSDAMSGSTYITSTSPYLNHRPALAAAAAAPSLMSRPMSTNLNSAASDTWSHQDPYRNSTISSPSQSSQPGGQGSPTILRAFNPSPRPPPDGPSPVYTDGVVSGSGTDHGGANLGQHRASQWDVVQQLLNRGVPATEITNMVRAMNEQGGSAAVPTGGDAAGIVPVASPPPPEYQGEKAEFRGL